MTEQDLKELDALPINEIIAVLIEMRRLRELVERLAVE